MRIIIIIVIMSLDDGGQVINVIVNGVQKEKHINIIRIMNANCPFAGRI